MPAWQPLATADTLRARAELLARIRSFFARRDVLEVTTPMLGVNTVTEPDVEAIAVPGYGYLQTSPEYFMKRLLAAGVPSCYQMAPAFRHEELGGLHHVEFCMLEWYRLGFDADQLMFELADLCNLVLGEAPYRTVTYGHLLGDVGRRSGAVPRDELDLAFAQACEQLTGRVFVVDYPAEQAVLAKLHADRPQYSARFELVIDGVEIANGYSELTDVEEHRRRFADDNKTRLVRGQQPIDLDEELLHALSHGLPDCAGVAVGVDRLVMRALEFERLDDVLTFRH